MKKIALLLSLIFFTNLGFAQTDKLENLCQVFHIPNKKDTTIFIVFGTKEDLKIKKPLFIFRQGSQPRPLLELYQRKFYPQIPFRIKPYQKDYHFVMIQKLGTVFLADSTYMTQLEEGLKTGDPKIFTKKYQENNNLDKATEQCNQVINYLVKQSWIDNRKIVFCGGSEGFTVGANLVANYNQFITHTILFSGHAGRRFEFEIYQIRDAVKQGNIDADTGQKQIEELYKLWEDICENPKSTDKSFGDTYYAWHSFSGKNLDNLLKIKTPLYIAYGTDDKEITIGLDYLPLDFIEKGKKNLTLKAYPNHDHQFFELKKDTSGKVIDKIYRGDDVAKKWMEWLK